MIEKFKGGPVGLDTLAASISEDAGTLEEVYEPYLLKNGFIQRTPRGRVVTELAYAHLGIPLQSENTYKPDKTVGCSDEKADSRIGTTIRIPDRETKKELVFVSK